ncbi:MAG: hypothetical protein RhofKO_14660 [Rhodothermales bacterium]
MTNRPPSSLPPLLQRALADEPADEQAALAKTWALLDHARPAEPSDATFAAMGTTIWSALDAEVSAAAAPLPDAVRQAIDAEPERESLATTWTLADEARRAQPPDSFFAALGSKIWAVLEEEINRSPRHDRAAVHRQRRISRRVWAPICAVALVLVIGGQWYRGTQPLTIATSPGETTTIVLADGSSVTLNSGSLLRYPRAFEDHRTVELEGEAAFDVVHDAKRPFTVETFNGAVEVLGTAFNVRARDGDLDAQTTVALYEGAVLVRHATTQATTELAPGEYISLDASGLSAVGTLAPDEISPDWQVGRFTLTNRPLSTVIAEAERRFDVDIDLPAELADEPLTLTHTTSDVATLLADIVTIKGLALETTATGYRLSRP